MFSIVFFAVNFLFFSGLDMHGPVGKQSPEGDWYGIITQDEGGYRQKYTIRLSLRLEGEELKGETYISTDDIFVRMLVIGEISSGMFISLADQEIIENKIRRDMEWCMKDYQLIFKYKSDRIDGFWQGKTSFGTCVPGKVHLTRYIPKA